jgi:3-hydroxymyristoyl/3-hydroxydecanoyl-(acyl carrier protein) dehydratase
MGRELVITKITRAKFQKIITPGTPCKVVWAFREEEDSFTCKCMLETEGNQASNFIMTLKTKSD